MQVNIDKHEWNLLRLIKRIGNGELSIKVQNGIPLRVFKTTENIDLSNDNEIEKVK